MDRLTCRCFFSLTALFLSASAGFCGQSASAKADNFLETSLRPVTIVSSPTGAQILINGEYVGVTPLQLKIAVDREGRCVKALDFRARRPPPYEGVGIRFFPAAAQDGPASYVPRVIDFDLNVHPMIVLR